MHSVAHARVGLATMIGITLNFHKDGQPKKIGLLLLRESFKIEKFMEQRFKFWIYALSNQ